MGRPPPSARSHAGSSSPLLCNKKVFGVAKGRDDTQGNYKLGGFGGGGGGAFLLRLPQASIHFGDSVSGKGWSFLRPGMDRQVGLLGRVEGCCPSASEIPILSPE